MKWSYRPPVDHAPLIDKLWSRIICKILLFRFLLNMGGIDTPIDIGLEGVGDHRNRNSIWFEINDRKINKTKFPEIVPTSKRQNRPISELKSVRHLYGKCVEWLPEGNLIWSWFLYIYFIIISKITRICDVLKSCLNIIIYL